MNYSLVQPLFNGPIDIVGDIHGEIDALQDLLEHLGYADDGSHPEGRRLVFLGDLTDRGPDSPAVVKNVKRFVDSGRAQCVLGNHDLNILLNDRKHDNHWFFGEEWSLDVSDESSGPTEQTKRTEPTPAVLADDTIRQTVVEFFQTLPLALERDDVRVVHACWDDSMVEIARHSNDVLILYRQHKDQIKANHLAAATEIDKICRSLQHQNKNPVKVLTSGIEERTKDPFWASGKLRFEKRVHWWADYNAQQYCIFGHYSVPEGKSYASEQALCVDFGVAKRWEERKESTFDGEFRGKLAALRIPERVVVFDDGLKKSSFLPSWTEGGGIVVDVHSERESYQLPSDAVTLPSFHVTLIGRKVFLESQDAIADVWESVRTILPLPPQPELDIRVMQATDEGRKTWFLHIVNQHEYRAYVQQLSGILDDALCGLNGSDFTNPETDRYFHMSVANNRDGDPLESIGSITNPSTP